MAWPFSSSFGSTTKLCSLKVVKPHPRFGAPIQRFVKYQEFEFVRATAGVGAIRGGRSAKHSNTLQDARSARSTGGGPHPRRQLLGSGTLRTGASRLGSDDWDRSSLRAARCPERPPCCPAPAAHSDAPAHRGRPPTTIWPQATLLPCRLRFFFPRARTLALPRKEWGKLGLGRTHYRILRCCSTTGHRESSSVSV